jgi:AmmeMemoRadiSam system protein A
MKIAVGVGLVVVGLVLFWSGVAPLNESWSATDGYFMSNPLPLDRRTNAVVATDVDLLRGRYDTLAEETFLFEFLGEPDDVRVLNGCIGAVESEDPLGRSTAVCSWRTAFADPRLPQLTRHDLGELDTEVSVLSELTPLEAGSQAEVVEDLEAGVDGLRITAGSHSALFLPSVWRRVDDPDEFVQRLFVKAGLPVRSWPGESARRDLQHGVADPALGWRRGDQVKRPTMSAPVGRVS